MGCIVYKDTEQRQPVTLGHRSSNAGVVHRARIPMAMYIGSMTRCVEVAKSTLLGRGRGRAFRIAAVRCPCSQTALSKSLLAGRAARLEHNFPCPYI